MAPFLRGGEVLTVKRVSPSSLRKGDLILFKDSRGIPILHRLVRKKRTRGGNTVLQTKGDACTAFDEPVEQDRILGKVSRVERAGSSGRRSSVDLESTRWMLVSYLLALFGLIRSAWYLSSLRRGLIDRLRRDIGALR